MRGGRGGQRRGADRAASRGGRTTARLSFDPDPDLLVAGTPLLADLVSSGPLRELAERLRERPSHAIRLLRPLDLLHLEVLAYRCRLGDGDDGPVLVADADDAWLEVRFPFQHVAEKAWYEITTPAPNPGGGLGSEQIGEEKPLGAPPTEARAAHGSRLVYEVPPQEAIGFSTNGILAALSRLPLKVPALATPRPESRRLTAFRDVLADLGAGLALTRDVAGRLVVRAAPAAWLRREEPADELTATLRSAHERIIARRLLAEEVALHLGGVAGTFEVDVRLPIPGRRPRRQASAPKADETAIEAPYRLFISPSAHGGFAHSPDPVAAPTDDTRVELWHSRLGVRRESEDGWVVDERADSQRIVRAVWARDLAYYSDAHLSQADAEPFDPFRTSLDFRDRRILVRQSAETNVAVPGPVEVERLHLSSLGAWLDLHGGWDHNPYSAAGLPAIESWDHVAPMARDQFVRVVYPGYLFPFGHQASLVKVTERKIKPSPTDPHAPQARLYQRKFIVVGEPVRPFEVHDLPFREVRVRPTVTPDLADPASASTPFVVQNQDIFWPVVSNQKFRFTLDTRDHDGRRIRLHLPLLFVASHIGATAQGRATVEEAYAADNKTAGAGQSTAFARSTVPGDTAVEVVTFAFRADPEVPGATPQATQRAVPHLVDADVVIPAARHLAPETKPVTVAYPAAFAADGFTDATEVFLELTKDPLKVSYSSGTDRAGGFVQPDLSPTQLSRRLGAVGDLVPAGSNFDPQQLLAGSLPRLFGLFDLWEVLESLGLDQLPRFVTESLDQVSALVTDLQRLADTVETTITRLQQDAQDANASVKASLDAARAKLEAQQAALEGHVSAIMTAFADVLGPGATKTPDDVIGAIETALQALAGIVDNVRAAIQGAPLPPTLKAQLERLVAATESVLKVAGLIEDVGRFLRAIDPEGLAVRASYVWQPVMKPWPSASSAVFEPQPDSFTLSVEARASASDGAGVDVLAELRTFSLHLLPGTGLMRMNFERIAFRASTGRKPETDVVFGGIEFLGVLGFIDTLRQLIPFDGFADPPYLDVSAEGVTAGFDLALPNVAVGVFSLENISLGADCRVPFLGDAVTVGFNFCTRERPFRMTVMAIGGGGFVAIRLSPQGLVVLEMALEAGASLSVDFGVASGSISAMVGIYLRLESDAGSLTGYFRLRGEVNVLGLVSASITLELSLTYEFASGKMVGKASLVVEVSVLFFSASVTISVERRLAGANGDPTFAEIMGVTPAGESEDWDAYCRAFAAE